MIPKAFLLSLLFCAIWLGSLYRDYYYQARLGSEWYIYKFTMLSNINFILDVVYSVIVVLSFKSDKLKTVADFMFFISVFPVGILICALFWGLHAVDPELVLAEWIALLIPFWMNHVLHTLPVVYVVCDLLTIKRSFPSVRVNFFMAIGLNVFYFSILLYYFFFEEWWLYPVLELLSPVQFVLVFVVSVLGFFGLIQAAVALNKLRWGTQPLKTQPQKSTKKKNKTK